METGVNIFVNFLSCSSSFHIRLSKAKVDIEIRIKTCKFVGLIFYDSESLLSFYDFPMRQVVSLKAAIDNHLLACSIFITGDIIEVHISTERTKFKLDLINVELCRDIPFKLLK